MQAGTGYRDCLFDPDDGVRTRLLEKVRRRLGIVRALGAHVALVRTCSLNPNGPYSPHRDNHRPACRDRLRLVMNYVNHFQTLRQVYDSRARLRHIFDCMGPISAIGHCKDIAVRDDFVIHMDEEVPGEGELHLATALRLWHNEHPDGYMMLEHLPDESYPLAAANVHGILEKEGIAVY